jgi:hypothetical protein
MSAHALCRCGEQGGTAQCPVHGQGDLPLTHSAATHRHQPLPVVRCSLCGQPLEARWDTGSSLDDRYIAVGVHRCPTQDVRVVDASALSDDELLAAVKVRGLTVG